jgi:hypothetical protein
MRDFGSKEAIKLALKELQFDFNKHFNQSSWKLTCFTLLLIFIPLISYQVMIAVVLSLLIYEVNYIAKGKSNDK